MGKGIECSVTKEVIVDTLALSVDKLTPFLLRVWLVYYASPIDASSFEDTLILLLGGGGIGTDCA